MTTAGRPPLVLIHGLIGELATPEVAAALGPIEWLAPDLLGYGSSPASLDSPTLEQQADHVAWVTVDAFGGRKVRLAGHSVGGAVAMVLAYRRPELVESVVSIEGNFTLEDAFWTRTIAAMSPGEVAAMMAGFRADPAGWLAKSGIVSTEPTLALARRWLSRQPDATIHAMAKAVVAGTGSPDYLTAVRAVVERVPVHLIAGERSAPGWHVPVWVRARAASDIVISGAGHMMMLEAPDRLAAAVGSVQAPPAGVPRRFTSTGDHGQQQV